MGLGEARSTTEKARAAGRRAITIQADVSSSPEVNIMVKTVERELGGHELVEEGVEEILKRSELKAYQLDFSIKV